MRCPFCAHPESKVIDSRPADEGASIRRRRECLACHKRFTTYETMESLPLMVVKKDGSRQSFDRNKVLGGLIRACEKRPVSYATLEAIVNDIEQTLQSQNGPGGPLRPDRRTGHGPAEKGGRGILRPLRLRLPPVQRHQHFSGRAE